jgi:hypothetical protein
VAGNIHLSGADRSIFNRSNNALTFGTNNTERARIDSSGRLLVGTSTTIDTSIEGATQSVRLQLAGNTNATSSYSQNYFNNAITGAASLIFNKSRNTTIGNHTIVGSSDTLGRVIFSGSDGTKFIETAIIAGQVDGTPGADDMPGRLVFSTTAAGASSPTERLRIKANGSILFAGNDETGILAGSVNGKSIEAGSIMRSSRATASSATHIGFYNTNGLVGQISTSASATSYTTSSDYRLKENVTAVTDGISRLQQLKPSRFNFIADPAKIVDGFLAHEVQEIVPEAITGEKDEVDDDGNPVYQGIDQSKLVPLLTAALQEAVTRIEQLEAAVTALQQS